MQRTFPIIFLYISLSFGASSIHPVVKSFLIPGWGDIELENNKSSRFFIQSEILLFTGCISAFHVSNLIEKKYITFASEHAGVISINDHRYWVDIGNYNTNIDFDSEHLRMRDEKIGQWSEHPWDWNNNHANRKKFENMRIDSDKYFLAGKFLIGGIIMNHIISSINTLYITRLNSDNKISLKTLIYKSNRDYKYMISLEF